MSRAGTVSLGLRGGSYYALGGNAESADVGVGIAGRMRAVEALGVEVAWTRHQDDWEGSAGSAANPLSLSGQLFTRPGRIVSPYLSAGYTWTSVRSDLSAGTTERLRGPHGGLGLEVALGRAMGLGVEGRYTHYGTLDDVSLGGQRAGALQGNLGMNFYF